MTARRTKTRKSMVVVDLTDGSGFLRATFFNQPFRERQLRSGMSTVLFGKVEVFNGRRQMTNPVVDLVGDKTGRIVAMYPQSEKAGVMTWDVDKWMDEVLRRAGEFVDPVPAGVLARWDLTDRTTAFHDVHKPESMAAAGEARRRLVFDELLRVQLKLVQRKRELERTTPGIRHELGGELVRRFHEQLPFPLTGAQRRVIGEIEQDLAGPHPMHRLLQGDVGAGKTIVAVSALLVAVQGGHQGALMAPTEVLAEQHFLGVRDLLEGFTVPDTNPDSLFGGAGMERQLRVELLTSRTTAAERRRILAGLAAGEIDLAIGTHALIQEGIEFRSLGVVVIDEQHRFGVEQRAALRDKSAGEAVPDVLVMTATPIPRTAAMTVYGDLDVSVLDEMPPGRTPIVTTWAKGEEEEPDVWALVQAQVREGRQAYVVCPLIEESEKLEVRSAEETYERLQAGELAGLRLGLLHGRVTAGEKEKAMALFRSGGLDVLVATTVIEVGVDVPNATVMVILDADRFGIAQLHQLRGRVGRGADQSLLRAGRRGHHARRRGPARGAGAHDRRVRAGRDRPRPPRRGHDHGRAPEGPQRPQAGVAAPRSRLGAAGPRRRLRAGRRRPHAGRATRCWPRRSTSSSATRTRPTSCSSRRGTHAERCDDGGRVPGRAARRPAAGHRGGAAGDPRQPARRVRRRSCSTG